MLRSRWFRLFALVFAFGLVAGACGDDDTTADTSASGTSTPGSTGSGGTGDTGAESDVSVGLVYDTTGRGDQSFNDSAYEGLSRAAEELGVEVQELTPDQGGENREELLRVLAEDGSTLVIGVGSAFAETLAAVAADYPDTYFGVVDAVIELPNVASLTFAEEQGSFLVGAAAGLTTETDQIGFIGGVEMDLIRKFEAGFVAGVAETNPDAEVTVEYIAPEGDLTGFDNPTDAKEIATSMYEDDGADIVYHVAGGSGAGLFQAAQEVSEADGDPDAHVWAIGVDSDQYETAGPEFQPYILTSMLKRVDIAVFEVIEAVVNDEFAGEVTVFDLAVDGVGFYTSGDYLADIMDQLDELKQQIIDGDIVVPTEPGG